MVDPLDATDMDMIRRGDMLGPRLGAKTAAYIESIERERDERASWAKEWHHTIETLATIHGLGILDRDEVIPAFGRYVDGLTNRAHAAEAQVSRLTEALRPFAGVDIQSVTEMAKFIDRAYLDHSPINCTVTKAQFKTALAAINHTDGDA